MARRTRKTVTKEGNKHSVPITWKTLLGAKAFGRGFREVKAGKPFNDDGLDGGDQWHYERGRLFAVVYQGKIKEGNRVITAAVYAAAEAFQSKSLI